MRYKIGCNIVDVFNQLVFACFNIALEPKIFELPSTKATKAFNFIYAFEKKQEVWHEILIISLALDQYYKNFCWLSLFRPSFFGLLVPS